MHLNRLLTPVHVSRTGTFPYNNPGSVLCLPLMIVMQIGLGSFNENLYKTWSNLMWKLGTIPAIHWKTCLEPDHSSLPEWREKTSLSHTCDWYLGKAKVHQFWQGWQNGSLTCGAVVCETTKFSISMAPLRSAQLYKASFNHELQQRCLMNPPCLLYLFFWLMWLLIKK